MLAKFFKVEINDLFCDKSDRIVIKQRIIENCDESINGIVVLLTDKEAVNELVKVLSERFGKK